MGEATMTRDFRTTDIQLASVLVVLGHPVITVEGPRDRRQFVFGKVPADVVASYYGGACQVRPRELFQVYRDLKFLVFQNV